MVCPLIRTPRLPVVDWTDSPAHLNGLVHFSERPNLVSARVPSRFKRAVPQQYGTNLLYNACKRCYVLEHETSIRYGRAILTDNCGTQFLPLTDCSLLGSDVVEIVICNRRLGGTCCLHFQSGRNWTQIRKWNSLAEGVFRSMVSPSCSSIFSFFFPEWRGLPYSVNMKATPAEAWLLKEPPMPHRFRWSFHTKSVTLVF